MRTGLQSAFVSGTTGRFITAAVTGNFNNNKERLNQGKLFRFLTFQRLQANISTTAAFRSNRMQMVVPDPINRHSTHRARSSLHRSGTVRSAILTTLAKRTNKIRILIVAVICICCATIVTVFLYYRRLPDQARDLVSSIPAGADLTIADIHQTATRDGRKEWSLDATSARYLNAEKRVILTELSMTFYLENQQDLQLTADSGVLLTESKDVEISGNVVVKSNDARLKTQDLRYRHEQRMLTSLSPVEISGDAYRLTAERMQIDLNTNRAIFEGNVSGAFIEDFSL